MAETSPSPGWTLYRDPDYDWSIAYPPNWIPLSAANTKQSKFFVTDDPKVDANQRAFNIQPGDGSANVLVDASLPGRCLEQQDNPGQTSESVAVAGVPATLLHWNPSPYSVYHTSFLTGSHCYRLSVQFTGVAPTTERHIVAGFLGSFRS